MLNLSFYWITRLDALNNLCVCLIVFGVGVCVVSAVLGFCYNGLSCDEDEHKVGKVLLNVSAVSLVLFVIGLLGSLFVPTTKEYCAIKLVDYLESNEKARELPDKIVDKAYDYFDSELKVDGKETKNDTRGKTQIQ